MPKISDERRDQLRRLRDQKQRIIGQLATKHSETETLMGGMSDETTALMQLSSSAAKEAHGKELGSMTMFDEIQAVQMAINKLETDKAKLEDELKKWEEWYGE